MPTRHDRILKAASLPKGDRERRRLLSQLRRAVMMPKETFQIVNVRVYLSITEDTLDQGAVGGPDDREHFDKLNGEYNSIQALISAVEDVAPASLDSLANWSIVEDGHISTSYVSDENFVELTRSERQGFLDGTRTEKTFLADVNVYFQFARVWTPNEREIQKGLKVR